jgi:predicted alpha/beta hydrolase family esterase
MDDFDSIGSSSHFPMISHSDKKCKKRYWLPSIAVGETMTEFIILPGIGGSGMTHWQTLWEERQQSMRRFLPTDWDHPTLGDWMAALERAIADASEPPLLVAHSLACLLVAHWSRHSSRKVAGAFLVTVPDPEGGIFPHEAQEFRNVPREKFDFPSLVVASSDDPYASLDYCRKRAEEWGSVLIDAGPLGHINGQSGIGNWESGFALLTAFAVDCRSERELGGK